MSAVDVKQVYGGFPDRVAISGLPVMVVPQHGGYVLGLL